MKCECGGDTTVTRVNRTYKGKKYQPTVYTCKECSGEFYFRQVYIPIKGRSLRGKTNEEF